MHKFLMQEGIERKSVVGEEIEWAKTQKQKKLSWEKSQHFHLCEMWHPVCEEARDEGGRWTGEIRVLCVTPARSSGLILGAGWVAEEF